MGGSVDGWRGKASGAGCTVGSGMAPRMCSVDSPELGSTEIWMN